jgi:hypothetical protein
MTFSVEKCLWFSFDGETQEFHETEAEARERCESALEQDQDIAASDGWPDWMECICYGKISHRVTETERKPWPVEPEDAEDPNYHPPFDEWVQYELKPIKDE